VDERRFSGIPGERSDDLPLRPPEPGPDGPAWDLPGERADGGGLEFDPLDSAPPAEPEPGRPLVLRIALSTAALIALVFVARDFWWPEPEAPETAPKWVAAPHLPAQAVPPPAAEPLVLEEEETGPETAPTAPAPQDGYEILQTEELAGEGEIPVPVAPREEIAAAEPVSSPEPPAAAREEPRTVPAVRREAVPERPALARRTLPPAPWEAGDQPAGLLRPGPGVQEPVPLELPRYRYPPAARGTGLEVGVRLALLVDERGRVVDAVVREGGPENLGFDQEALRVARNIPFQPATRYDVPGKMWTEMILEFAE
jgi:TonB family protein